MTRQRDRCPRVRMLDGVLIAFVLCAGVLAATTLSAQDLNVQVRDAVSGAFLDADLELVMPDGAVQRMRTNAGRAQVPALDLGIEVNAPGYASLRSQIAGSSQALQLWLDPLTRHTRAQARSTEFSVLEGHIYNPAAGRPVDGAEVSLQRSDAGARSLGDRSAPLTQFSDAHGYFRFDLEGVTAEAGEPALLRVQAPGLALWEQALRLTAGSSHRIIDLGGGSPGPDHRFDSTQSSLDVAEDLVESRAPILAPPVSIRVGFADAGFTTPCCVGSCNAVSVMTLETYVRRGLNDEWIASWTGDSLRAGAIAYRSYGAWHVANPRTSNYDICSSACCQVNDPDTSANTNAAVDATAGMLLIRDGVAFRSEYSAENNAWDDPNDGLSCVNVDLSCGDGFVGSPSAGWPCLADAVAAGRGCFGHGRGMSQWGTQRWANLQGRRWPWIVDHYYNDNNNASGAGGGLRNALMTSPLRINQMSVPATATPGSSIVIQLDISNLAAQAHDPVWIGASLFRTGVGFVSDPPRDQAVRLEPGSQQRNRQFVLPASLPPGSYDLLVALYFDIDGNGAINSGDLALTTARENGVLAVVTGPLFADGFELP